jgi:hypothetical protein
MFPVEHLARLAIQTIPNHAVDRLELTCCKEGNDSDIEEHASGQRMPWDRPALPAIAIRS